VTLAEAIPLDRKHLISVRESSRDSLYSERFGSDGIPRIQFSSFFLFFVEDGAGGVHAEQGLERLARIAHILPTPGKVAKRPGPDNDRSPPKRIKCLATIPRHALFEAAPVIRVA